MTNLMSPPSRSPVWLSPDDCRLDHLRALVERDTAAADHPYADEVQQGVLVYDCERLRETIADPGQRREVEAAIVYALTDGPGVTVFKRAFADTSVVDKASTVFTQMIATQHADGGAAGDHFARPGANDRVWNALEKLAVEAPGVFVDYYANDILALVSNAWLGPGYQVTSAINVVNPGGEAQVAHRDYHLGFMSDTQAARFPAHVHRLSPRLTLQGAVAHSDMPVETGPTMYLPYSHQYEAGYLAAGRPEFTSYFDEHLVQLPLRKGDAAFFNPALLHGAGRNQTSTVKRMANLLQVSSAFGRALEAVDRERVCAALYPTLLERKDSAPEPHLRNVVAASAEGYAFPTNLDRDQPVGGLTPETQAELVWRALTAGWDPARLRSELSAHSARHRSAG